MKIQDLAIIYSILSLTACAITTVKLYEGEQKKDAELSQVRVWSLGILVKSIDDKPSTPNLTESHAYILPGRHIFKIRMLPQVNGIMCIKYCEPEFMPEHKLAIKTIEASTDAGHTYLFKMLEDKSSVEIEDKGTDYDPVCLNPREFTKGKNC